MISPIIKRREALTCEEGLRAHRAKVSRLFGGGWEGPKPAAR